MKTRTLMLRLSAAGCVLLTLVSAVSAQRGWVPYRVNTGGADLNTVYFSDSKRGWVGGDEGFLRAGNSIFVTRDNGNSWTKSRTFLPEEFEGAEVELYSVRFSSKNKGWVVGSVSKRERVVDSILVYTDDAGQSWRRQRAPSRLELIHIDFVSDKRGWIVGADGTVLFTRDSGESWTKQNTGTNATLYHVDFRGDKRGWAVGERGTILRTTDGGETWTAISTSAKIGRASCRERV